MSSFAGDIYRTYICTAGQADERQAVRMVMFPGKQINVSLAIIITLFMFDMAQAENLAYELTPTSIVRQIRENANGFEIRDPASVYHAFFEVENNDTQGKILDLRTYNT